DLWVDCPCCNDGNDYDDLLLQIGLSPWDSVPGETKQDRRVALQRRYGDTLTPFQLDVLSSYYGVRMNPDASVSYTSWLARLGGFLHGFTIQFEAVQCTIVQVAGLVIPVTRETVVTPTTLALLP